MTIKAIETRYKGYRFRSRLEARWAVFFDALGIRYQYEPQGFQIYRHLEQGDPWLYLPDFFLTDLGTWVEVKGSLDDVSDDYFEMIASAIDWGGYLPGVAWSGGTTHGLLWLGPIPDEDLCSCGAPTHVILQHDKGGWINFANFFGEGELRVTDARSGERYFDSSTGVDGAAIKLTLAEATYDTPFFNLSEPCDRMILRAYRAARSARFEHGETPHAH